MKPNRVIFLFSLLFVCSSILNCSGMLNSFLSDDDIRRKKLLKSPKTSTITGKIVLCPKNNSGNAGVKISLTGPVGTQYFYTGDDGQFSVTNLYAGSYSVIPTEAGVAFIPDRRDLVVNVGEVSTADFSTVIHWDKRIGGSGTDIAHDITETDDCGFVIAGSSDSTTQGDIDFSVVRLDPLGRIVWEKKYGGSSTDVARVVKAYDSNYYIAGYTESTGKKLADYALLKIDPLGSLTWEKTYGGPEWDAVNDLFFSSDGNIILAGFSESTGIGRADFRLYGLNYAGQELWTATAGDDNQNQAYAMCQSPDGGYLTAGHTVYQGDAGSDALFARYSSDGGLQWTKTISTYLRAEVYSIAEKNGNYYGVGFVKETIIDLGDIWFFKLNSNGDLLWDKQFGGGDTDKGYALEATSDGMFVLAGYTYSAASGSNDMIIIKVNEDGDVQWERVYDAEGSHDLAYSIKQTFDGGFVVAGESTSLNNKEDMLILKLNSIGLKE